MVVACQVSEEDTVSKSYADFAFSHFYHRKSLPRHRLPKAGGPPYTPVSNPSELPRIGEIFGLI
jgi:hypothetical protein